MKSQFLAAILALSTALSALAGCTASTPETPTESVSPADAEIASETMPPVESSFTLSDETASKAQQMADTIISDYGVPSVQYAIISDGEMILSGGSGSADKNTGTPVSADTMYCVGSISKVYTVCAVMMLVDEGKVDIDTPVVQYIPEFKTRDARSAQITPRMLMNYSSGLYGTNYKDGFTLGDPRTANHDNLLANLALEGLKCEPGAYSYYCNDGIALLEILVERVSGQSFTDFIRERISKPLGLTNTATPLEPFSQEQLAKLYHPLAPDALPEDTVNLIGSGGIYSTAEELCLFAEVLMGNKPEVLSAESALAMRAEEYKRGEWAGPEEGFFAYGLGFDSVYNFPFRTYDIQAVSKGGSTLLTNSSLVTIPEHNLAMAVASSGGSAFYNNVFACAILQEVLVDKDIIEAVAPPRTLAPPQPQEPPAELLQHSGLYGRALEAPVAIDITTDGFTFADPLGLSVSSRFVYIGDNQFSNEDGTLTASFETAENGNIYLLLNAITTLPGLGQAAISYNAGQKLTGEPLDADMAAIWQAREGRYYILDDAPTSQLYMGILFNFNMRVTPEHSYAMGCRILDENNAVNNIASPLFHVACDVGDLEFFSHNGTELLKCKGYTLIGEHNLTELDPNEPIHVIGEDGYAMWYKIPAAVDGRNITVQLPENGTFTVFDQNASCVFFSAASGSNSATLPAGGTIAFIGDAADTFAVTYTA